MRKKTLLLSFFFCLLANLVSGQDVNEYEISDEAEVPIPINFSLYANASIPSAEFKKAIDNQAGGMGIGLNLNMVASPYWQKKYSPLLLGLDFNYLHLGRDKVDETATAPPYKTSYNYYTIGGIGRFLLRRGYGLTPFIDGSVGLKVYNSKTKIDKNAFDTVLAKEQPEVINDDTNTGLTYGAGIGFFSRSKGTGVTAEQGFNASGSFSVRLMYMWGNDIEYVKRGSVHVDNGIVSFEKGYTRTDMLMIQLGLYLH